MAYEVAKWGGIAIAAGATVVGAMALLDYAEEQRLDNQLSLLAGQGTTSSQTKRSRNLISMLLERNASRKEPPLQKYVTVPSQLPRPGGPVPVLLLPGLGCSRLYAIPRQSDVGADPELLWVSLAILLPKQTETARQWKQKMMCTYDPVQQDWVSSGVPDVHVTAWPEPCFDSNGKFRITNHVGGTAGCCDTVAALAAVKPRQLAITTGFRTLVETFTSNGYVVGHTLFGMGYDYRRLTGRVYWGEVVNLLEHLLLYIRVSNGGRRVAVICHSLGGLLFLAAARTRPSLLQHVQFWCPINSPWGGAPRALQAVLSGSSYGLNMFSPKGQTVWFQDAVCNWSGLLATAPRETVYSDVVIETPLRRYTTSDEDIEMLLRDTDNENAADAWRTNVCMWRRWATGGLSKFANEEAPSHLEMAPMVTCWRARPSSTPSSTDVVNPSSDIELVTAVSVDDARVLPWVPPEQAKHMCDAFQYRPRTEASEWAARSDSFAATHKVTATVPPGKLRRTNLAASLLHHVLSCVPIEETRTTDYEGQSVYLRTVPRASLHNPSSSGGGGREDGEDSEADGSGGDGTVGSHSLYLANLLGPLIVVQEPSLDHTGALSHPVVLHTLLRQLRRQTLRDV